jgi:hypothetical protein
MHRRSRRLVAALFLPWFAVVTAEPAAFHSCAMHSRGAAHESAATEPATANGGQAGNTAAVHSMTMHEHHAEPGSDASTPERGGATQCTCDSGCCVAAAATTPPPCAELLVVPGTIRREVPLLGSTGVSATATPHVLPFANGPPARV